MNIIQNDKIKKNIDSIEFGIFSDEEIEKLSVCEIYKDKIDSKVNNNEGTVYDNRLGTLDIKIKCVTCKLNYACCTGHFGHIVLNTEVVNPLYYKNVLNFLRCFCINCSSLLISQEQIEFTGINKYKGQIRFKNILEKCNKIERCLNCNEIQPKIEYNNTESTYWKSIKKKNEEEKIILLESSIKKIFDNISNNDISLLGLNPKLIHLKNLIFTKFPVIPTKARPYVFADGKASDDDLTNQYQEIIKSNNSIKTSIKPDDIKRHVQSLKFRIKCLFDNTKGKATRTNGKIIKGIKERLTGKEGLIRNNLLGKRCNQSGRTVIGPDPMLKVGELAIPIEMASNLTKPERVTEWNIDYCYSLLKEGKVNKLLRKDNEGEYKRIDMKYALYKKQTKLYFGDEIKRGNNIIKINSHINLDKFKLQIGDEIKRDNIIIKEVSIETFKPLKLLFGDILERQLLNGDVVLFNRQPTLHRNSMITHTVVIRPYKTLRFCLATTSGFNADFKLLKSTASVKSVLLASVFYFK